MNGTNFGLILCSFGSFMLGLQASYLYLNYKYNLSKKPVCTCGPSNANGCSICCLRSEFGMIKLSKDEIRSMGKGKVDWR